MIAKDDNRGRVRVIQAERKERGRCIESESEEGEREGSIDR